MTVNSTNATATNKKISELYRNIKDGDLILQPEFQRKFVWNNNHRKNFIETIIRGLPFPEIYIADHGVDLDKIASQEVVVDGQQRLSTIVQFIDGTLKILPSDNIKPFADYDAEHRKKFLSYKVTVRQLEGVDSSAIKEIFRRINLTRYSLNAYEIQHAIYDGEFIGVAKDVIQEKVVKDLPTFAESDYSRMYDLGFFLLVMATIEHGGYFQGDREIETYVKQFDSEYPNKAKMKKELIRIAGEIGKFKLGADSIWFKKSSLFTLFVELSISGHKTDLTEKLNDFEVRLQQNKDIGDKEKNDFSRYYFYTAAGTNSRQARVERSRIFRKYVLGESE